MKRCKHLIVTLPLNVFYKCHQTLTPWEKGFCFAPETARAHSEDQLHSPSFLKAPFGHTAQAGKRACVRLLDSFQLGSRCRADKESTITLKLFQVLYIIFSPNTFPKAPFRKNPSGLCFCICALTEGILIRRFCITRPQCPRTELLLPTTGLNSAKISLDWPKKHPAKILLPVCHMTPSE